MKLIPTENYNELFKLKDKLRSRMNYIHEDEDDAWTLGYNHALESIYLELANALNNLDNNSKVCALCKGN